jgi:hypothetical protein
MAAALVNSLSDMALGQNKGVEKQPSSAPQASIYIDENAGNDKGATPSTKELPFQTLFAAYVAFPPDANASPPAYVTHVTKPDQGAPEWKEPHPL